MRHIATHYRWLQEKVARGNIEVIKIKGDFNSADIFTKDLDNRKLTEAVHQFGHAFESGRSESAPDLDLVEEANGLMPLFLMSIGIKADHV